MKFIRLAAQLIDIFLCFAVLIGSFLVLSPLFLALGFGTAAVGVAVLVIDVLVLAGLQYLFLKTGQTVGKAFFGLRVESELPERPLTVSIMVQREIFLKLFTCYFICIPMLWGAKGGHDVAAQTVVTRVVRVVRNKKSGKRVIR